MSASFIIRTLGYAGLIPFVVPAMLVAADSSYADIAIFIAETYAFGIICFLSGSWWGMAFGSDRRVVLVLSNVYFLIAFLLWTFASAYWALCAAVLLFGQVLLERDRGLFSTIADYYRHMRTILTLASSSSMLIIHLAR
ncbi:MAG: hypothetical protein ACI9LO_002180 [Planctomycetota bacterium]|jgi:hypothetical protein